MKIGDIRVSKDTPATIFQEAAMKREECQRVFTDKMTGSGLTVLNTFISCDKLISEKKTGSICKSITSFLSPGVDSGRSSRVGELGVTPRKPENGGNKCRNHQSTR